MAKRKKGSKVQKRAKLRKGNSAKRSKPRKRVKSATAKRAKPKSALAKKVARKGRLPVRPAVEIVAAEVIEQPTSGAEVEENTGK
jgi:hypothetical protein